MLVPHPSQVGGSGSFEGRKSGYFQEEREKKSNEWSTSAIEMAGKGNGRDPRKDLELKK